MLPPGCAEGARGPPPHEVVVIKWGGGLITDKTRTLARGRAAMSKLARAVKMRAGKSFARRRVVLVHGAGSFGHLRAKAWRLAEGRLPAEACVGCAVQDPSREKARDRVMRLVRQEMLLLNSFVCKALREHGMTPCGPSAPYMGAQHRSQFSRRFGAFLRTRIRSRLT